MRARFDLRHVECFLAVARTGSFRGAARHLNVAQPALSRTVRNLEEAVGTPLLLRDRRRAELTPAGLAFVAGGADLLRRALDLEYSAARAQSGLVGHLRIGYTDFAIAGALPDILRAFRARYPDVAVTFTPSVTAEQIKGLRSAAIDAGFLTGPVTASGLQTHIVQRDHVVAVLPVGHRLAAQRLVALGDLADDPFVIGQRERWSHFLAHATRLCQDAGFLPKAAHEAADSEGILGLVAAGMGVTLSIDSIASRRRRGVVMRRLTGAPHEVPTLVAWRDSDDNPALRRFLDIAAGF